MRIDKSFPANYEIDVDPGWPEFNEIECQFTIDRKFVLGGTKEYRSLRFYPETAEMKGT